MLKVSVIITNFNNSEHIDRAIRSIDNQIVNSSIEIETIIIDDGSKDQPKKWLNKYKKVKNKKLIYLKKNFGVGYASSLGVKKSLGQYIVRLDSDDFIAQNYIQSCCDILSANNKISYVYCDLFHVDKFENKLKVIKRDKFETLLKFGAGCVIRKSVIQKVGNYNPNLKNCEDFDLMIRINNKGYKGFYLPYPYYRYFKFKNSLSNQKKRKFLYQQMEKKWNLK